MCLGCYAIECLTLVKLRYKTFYYTCSVCRAAIYLNSDKNQRIYLCNVVILVSVYISILSGNKFYLPFTLCITLSLCQKLPFDSNQQKSCC